MALQILIPFLTLVLGSTGGVFVMALLAAASRPTPHPDGSGSPGKPQTASGIAS